MITIGKIPQKVNSFKPIKNDFSAHIYSYYCNLVVAIYVSYGSTIQKLVELLRDAPHRTNHGEFIWRQEVHNVIKYSHEKSVIRRLEKLLAA